MGFLDRFKKEPEKTQKQILAEEKAQAAGVRAKSENLLAVMKKVNLFDPTGRIPKEDVQRYKVILDNLSDRLDKASVSVLDTQRMDEQMVWLTEHLEIAVREGRGDTAERIIKALMYGVGRGHEPIPASDASKAPQIIREREDRLNKYITTVEFSEKIDERTHSIEMQQERYDKAKAQFKEAYAKVKQEMRENPHLVEMIDQYGEKVKDINVDAFKLALKYRETQKLYKDLDMLKKQMAVNETTINSCLNIIRSVENALTELATPVTQEMQDRIIQQEAQFRNHLVELQKQITELNDLSDRFNYAIDEVFSSPVMGDYIIDAAMRFQEMEDELAAEEAGRQRGRELMRQQELNNENSENQEQRILNS
ncbi:MAG TPA: hypothetical protein IAB46_04550 [Candidatus Scybalocola faecigallinarum]|uniref:Uncharacterized protein n=1 Tax=Candidatus Scybalocola faecigallinarum TaxID=2840941 RepID=A0A9D1JQK6_9FIRM|nr:hypothetical protein [Candidatus Scybalocola faecigallinarum]